MNFGPGIGIRLPGQAPPVRGRRHACGLRRGCSADRGGTRSSGSRVERGRAQAPYTGAAGAGQFRPPAPPAPPAPAAPAGPSPYASTASPSTVRGLAGTSQGVERIVCVACGSKTDSEHRREGGQWRGIVASSNEHGELEIGLALTSGFQAVEWNGIAPSQLCDEAGTMGKPAAKKTARTKDSWMGAFLACRLTRSLPLGTAPSTCTSTCRRWASGRGWWLLERFLGLLNGDASMVA